jgi:MOSC domain-containing protein YiiM
MNALVVAINVVHDIKSCASRVGHTGIDKRPVDGPVQVGRLGPAGDVQCDRSRHGGPDQAVYAYDEAEAQRWAAELGRPVPPGWFGENLTMRGVAVTDAVIGERWQLGPEVQVEVTAPRTPCATFAEHVEQSCWVSRFTERGDVGAYLRVLVPGSITAGDRVHRLAVPGHGITVREVFAALMNGPVDPDRMALLLQTGALSAKLRRKLSQLVPHSAG